MRTGNKEGSKNITSCSFLINKKQNKQIAGMVLWLGHWPVQGKVLGLIRGQGQVPGLQA